jgi:GTP pyrophosphokinase
MLTNRFDEALHCAADWHRSQRRKGTTIPYISHLLSVAGLALEYGATEDEAIGALLHDAVEDAGGAPRLAEIRERFGPHVARLVADCTDTDVKPKPPWRERKLIYIQHLGQSHPAALFVSCCDKLHNSRSIVADLREFGAATWTKFQGGRDGSLWYYRTLATEYARLGVQPRLVGELERSVTEMERLAAETNVD